MNKIIRQIKEHEVYNVVSRIHDQDDIQNGDLAERIEAYDYYNHVEGFLISDLSLDSYNVDQDKVDDIIEEIQELGIGKMPKIVIDEKFDVIDGLHRLNALHQLGYTNIDLLQGTNQKHNPVFKKELIEDQMQIYKISNNFGSISIMENAKYSPADNSIFEFLVEEKYRGLGVGTELLKEAMAQYPNIGAQVSSIASLKVFLECGFQPQELTTKENCDLDTTSYDFKTFNKEPLLLNGQAAMYRNSLEIFNKKLEESIDLFEANGQSLYFEDTRLISQNLSNKKNKKFKL
jgi:GNAT superfamily N-acetyltransferase